MSVDQFPDPIPGTPRNIDPKETDLAIRARRTFKEFTAAELAVLAADPDTPIGAAAFQSDGIHGPRIKRPNDWRHLTGEVIHVKRDFDAPGDGANHLLSSRYATLPDAQVDFPSATALSNEIDWAAWQSAVKAVQDAGEGEVAGEPGVYMQSASVLYIGNASKTITISGTGHAGKGPSGCVFQWVGPVGGTVIATRGMNASLIQGICFMAELDNCPSILIDVISNQFAGGSGAQNSQIRECHFGRCAGPESSFVRLGNDTAQVDEIHVSDSTMSGESEINFPTDAPTYGIITHSANSKNFSFDNLEITYCDYGIAGVVGSGYNHYSSIGFANQRLADFKIGNGWHSIVNCGSESSVRFIVGAGGATPTSIGIYNTYFDGGMTSNGTPASDDYMIQSNGALFLVGCDMRNSRTPASECRIKSNSPASASPSSVVSFGTFYKNSERFIPVFNGGGAHWVDAMTETTPQKIMSFGDMGGDSGALTRLVSLWGEEMYINNFIAPSVSQRFRWKKDQGAGVIQTIFELLSDTHMSPDMTAMRTLVRYGATAGVMRDVTIGAADSGGTGFRALVVPNT